jgi:tungstate transport system substrate-binding protein
VNLMKRIAKRNAAIVAIAASLLGFQAVLSGPAHAQAGANKPAAVEIKMATTTSTEASGLLGILLPQFERATGIKVKVISVGTGQALKLGERGDVDVVLVHSRPDEDKYMAGGFGTVRRDVMYNDFIIVGDKADPAKVRSEKNASSAMKRIAEAGAAGNARFVSRGDDSGTHKKELALWKEVDIVPKNAPGAAKWYLEVGQGMGETLTMAGNLKAYTLADRGTFLAHRGRVGLDLVVSQVPGLYNPYGIMDVNPAKHPHAKNAEAKKLIEWMVSAEGRAAIASLKVDGTALFTPGLPPADVKK